MTSKLLLFQAMMKREIILTIRYFSNSLAGLITLYIVFLLMFYGYKEFAGGSANLGRSIEGLVVGYTLWFLALSVYQDITYTIIREAREGTLEQLYMSSYGFGWVLTLKTVASSILNLIMVFLILLLLMFTTGKYLNLDLVSLLPVIFFILLGLLGLGLALGGITLIFKRSENYLQIMNFALIALIAMPGRTSWIRYLPLNWGSTLIYEIMVDGKYILEFSWTELLFLVGIGLLHFMIGYLVYKKCEQLAMQKGMLGHY